MDAIFIGHLQQSKFFEKFYGPYDKVFKIIFFKDEKFIMFDVYMLNEDFPEPKEELTAAEIHKHAEKVHPSLPHETKKHEINYYRHNGYLFHLKTNRKYIIMANCASRHKSTEECKFMIRAIGSRIEMKHLD